MKTKTSESGAAPAVDLHRLVRQLRDLEETVIKELRREYPAGTRVIFWRSANQKKESFGTVLGHSMAHGPELRVRYDDSTHVVGLHVGHTKFHSLPNEKVRDGGPMASDCTRDAIPPFSAPSC